jgi:predicted transglutaminase-like cysteine proteinase
LLYLESLLLQIEALDLAAPQKLCAKRDLDEMGRGHVMASGTKTLLKRSAYAAIAVWALIGSPTGGRAEQRPLFIDIGGVARPPIGWVEFCVEYDPECKTKPSVPRDVVLSTQAWGDLQRINLWVNTHVKPMTDMDHWGVVERWNYPDDGYGDCEDYALEKRKMLIQAGWPREALLMTVVRDKNGDGHAILTAKTDKGEYILDNQTGDILLWSDTGYRFVKRQSQSDPNVWVALGDSVPAPATASSR